MRCMRPTSQTRTHTKRHCRTHKKIIKDAGGVYIAGGVNKAKVDHGSPAVGNRYVIIRYENEAAYNKFYNAAARIGLTRTLPKPATSKSRASSRNN